jgi:hypothetical protein
MHPQSLFGHLAFQFSSHPENLATEALHYILGRSVVARLALIRFLSQAGTPLPTDLTFRTQVYDEVSGIPDLVGADGEGRPRLVAEAKFWAGLTQKQPSAYVGLLPEHTDALLLFIAPALRLGPLWSELIRRCHDSGIRIANERQVVGELWAAAVGEKRALALISWASLLAFIQRALETEREMETVSDLAQLQGLCARMDEDAFLPLRSEELTGTIGARVYQLCQLVDGVCQASVSAGFASTQGLKTCHGMGYWGRYLRLAGWPSAVYFSSYKWARVRPTPLWLTVLGEEWNWKPSRSGGVALAALSHESPPRLVEDKEGLHVPLNLPVGVEKDHVVSELVNQLRDVGKLLACQQPAAVGMLAPEPGADR